jgi:hypothetical protein
MSLPQIKKNSLIDGAPALVCWAAVAVSLVHYLRNPSFWMDEGYLASDLLIISFGDVFKLHTIFPQQPRTPIFFQLIVKFFGAVFGPSEMSYRLWPLLAGLLSLGAFSALLKRTEGPVVRFVCLALFAFNPAFFYYSVELKPYASDALTVLLIYLIFEHARSKQFALATVRVFAAAAGLALFFSYPSVFVSLGIIVAMLAMALWRRERSALDTWCKAALIYAFIFVLFYGSVLRQMVDNDYLIGTWAGSFLPYQDGLWASLCWLARSLLKVFDWPLPMTWPFLGLALFLYGAQDLLAKRPQWAMALLAPLGACLAAACLQMYPFNGRMLFFLLPNICLIVSVGFIALAQKFKAREIVVVACLFFVIFLRPVDLITDDLIRGIPKAENRKIYEIFHREFAPGDAIYYNNSAQYTFVFYVGRKNFLGPGEWVDVVTSDDPQELKLVVGKMDDFVNVYEGDRFVGLEEEGHIIKSGRANGLVERTQRGYIDRYWHPSPLSRKRVWLIFSHFYPSTRDFILGHFDRFGTQRSQFRAYDAELYLYEMGTIEPPQEGQTP